MCGIIGMISSKKEQFPIKETIDKLKRLEYRGYDSWGIAFKDGDNIKIIKEVGNITTIKNSEEIEKTKSFLSIAHTRWATHGNVSEKNAHPHYSNNKKVFLVHNGIIENFNKIKNELINKGYSFYSDTDSEVLANLIEISILENKDILKAVEKALLKVEGSYALAMIIEDYLIGIANNSPLILGINTKESKVYLSSDAKSFIDSVDKVYALEDGDLVIIKTNHTLEMNFYNIFTKQKIEPEIEEVKDRSNFATYEPLNGYEHYTIKEIEEQKYKLKEAFAYMNQEIKKALSLIKSSKGVFFVASGSSYNACLLASYLFSSIAKMHVNVVDASEFEYYKHFITSHTLVVGVSQSGETADVIEAIKIAKNKGAKIIGITNMYKSTLYRLCDLPILMQIGSEISVIATKTYSAQLLILISLIYALTKEDDNHKEIHKRIEELSDQISFLLQRNIKEKIKEIAYRLKNKEHLYIIGRGVNYATALEGALKIKEISYIHAEAFAGGALKHGSIALISPESYVIAIAPEDDTYKEIISNVMEVKARGAKVIGITTKHNDVFDIEILLPKNNIFQPILNIIPLQLLAYYLAILRELNPDRPRNLAKSVTVK